MCLVKKRLIGIWLTLEHIEGKLLESAGYPILHLVMFTDAVHISITAYACIQNVFARAFMPRKKAHFIL